MVLGGVPIQIPSRGDGGELIWTRQGLARGPEGSSRRPRKSLLSGCRESGASPDTSVPSAIPVYQHFWLSGAK
ncbi:Uncharacterised protein [Mycobacteroides abscessus subsp. abscessus]|nr:Uncharacterised protein [Mycobacteroides abscessus subsp. abscessus]